MYNINIFWWAWISMLNLICSTNLLSMLLLFLIILVLGIFALSVYWILLLAICPILWHLLHFADLNWHIPGEWPTPRYLWQTNFLKDMLCALSLGKVSPSEEWISFKSFCALSMDCAKVKMPSWVSGQLLLEVYAEWLHHINHTRGGHIKLC